MAADTGGIKNIRVSYRIKLLVFLVGALAALSALSIGYSALNTLSRLDTVEAERDQWQRPRDVLQALELKPGDTAVDLGSGSGYFTLKLSSPVGAQGRVIAEDIRRLPLAFLWFRTVLKYRNVAIELGKPADPHLPKEVNAVLIVNTYHEFTDAQEILSHVRESLVSGGHLVVADRAPDPAKAGTETGEHEISADQVQSQLQQNGFVISSRQDHFIEADQDPDHESWWLVVARKP
jgi:predicted methyltransferase